MSSMLAVYPGSTDLTAVQYRTSSNSVYGSEGSLLHGRTGSARHCFKGGLPTPPNTKDMSSLSIPNGPTAYNKQQHPYVSEQRAPSSNGASTRMNVYFTNGKRNATEQDSTGPTKSSDQEDQIAPHLQIPESVNNSKKSLAEFAAEMTCLFWFETSATIDYADSLPRGTMPERGINTDGIPSIGFRKWVTTILSTTQVGKNVILLALMFIYRLKKFNPGVSGKRGSEFRLLTIALMLGNKFLDDNTYTNKTWAEVSGISVNEIHIMEVEFLSNMRYELYASEAQWREWQERLGRLASFYEKAALFSTSKTTSPTTPITHTVSHKLPSPPSGGRYVNSNYSSLPNPMQTIPPLQRSPAVEYSIDRKRSLDTTLDLPPAKRLHSSFSTSSFSPAALTPISVLTPDSASSALSYDHPRLPQLPMPTLPNPATRNGTQLAPLSLPGPRAMSTVYPSTPTTAGPNFSSLPLSKNAAPSLPGSAHTSPTNLFGISTPTRPGLSPSYFLMNRSSPYRPVCNVNTLLYPPPSAAMQNPVRNIDYQQMHYQPLSKSSNQLHTGPMPYVQHDAWQSQSSTPVHQVYRPY